MGERRGQEGKWGRRLGREGAGGEVGKSGKERRRREGRRREGRRREGKGGLVG